MIKLMDSVNKLIDEEYGRASEKFGPVNSSDHESFAITLEEFQEALNEQTDAATALDKFWNLTKVKDAQDADKQDALCTLFNRALLAACEWIQVAAMAKKASLTIAERNVSS